MNDEMTGRKGLLTVAEAAVWLGVGRSFLYERLMRKEIPSISLGRARRIPIDALERYVENKLNEEFPDLVQR